MSYDFRRGKSFSPPEKRISKIIFLAQNPIGCVQHSALATGFGMSHSHWTNADDHARRARRFMAEKRWHEAVEELRAAVAINPFNPEWYFHLGRGLDELHRHEEAIEAYSQVILIDPYHLHALNHMGVSLHQIGRYQEALAVFKKIEQTDPEYEPAYCNRIRIYTELGDHQAAEEMFYTARLYRDQCPVCYENIAHSLLARKEYDRAIFCWQKTIDLSGDDVRLQARIAHAYALRGQYEQARRHYLDGLKLDPHHLPTLLEYVHLLIQMGHLDEAAAKLKQASQGVTTDAGITFAQARLDLAQNRPEQAELSLRLTLQLDPTFIGANLLLARIAYQRQDLIRAKSHLRAELMLRPDSPQILLDLSNMLLDVGEIRLGVACLRRLISVEPDNINAWQNLGVAECLRGRFEQGISACIRALEIDPHNLAVRHNLALAYMDQGELGYAWEEINSALKLFPGDRLIQRLWFRIWVKRWYNALTRWLR